MSIVLTEFARRRLFGPARGSTRIEGCTAEEFQAHLVAHPPERWIQGYAPFCKLLVYRNWTPTRLGAVPITADNERCLRSAYEARNENELPVLVRWLEGIRPEVAAYLLVIVYSAEQLVREGAPIEAPWGVVGCLAVDEPVEPPMAPITLLRNALGPEEGGSGVLLDRAVYLRSVDYWSRHANVRFEGSSEEGVRS